MKLALCHYARVIGHDLVDFSQRFNKWFLQSTDLQIFKNEDTSCTWCMQTRKALFIYQIFLCILNHHFYWLYLNFVDWYLSVRSSRIKSQHSVQPSADLNMLSNKQINKQMMLKFLSLNANTVLLLWESSKSQGWLLYIIYTCSILPVPNFLGVVLDSCDNISI